MLLKIQSFIKRLSNFKLHKFLINFNYILFFLQFYNKIK